MFGFFCSQCVSFNRRIVKMNGQWKSVSASSFLSRFLLMLLWCCSCCFTESVARLLLQQESGGGEAEALMAFKKSSVSADPSGFLKGWVSDSPSPCSWRGVLCSGDGSVTVLNLTNAGVVGRLHLSDLMALPRLARLHLGGNSFTGNLSDVSDHPLCSFEILDLSSNMFSGPIAARSLLHSCDRLVFLNLSRNSITGVSLFIGSSLRRLDLSRNSISDMTLLNYTFSNCQNLNLLNVSDNKLRSELGTSLSSCKNLSILDLSCNQLSGPIPTTFIAGSPASLDFLDLSHNNFTTNFAGLEFGNCANVTVLNLSHNRVYGEEFPRSLLNCLALETLDISHNELELKIPGDLLGRLKNLRRLFLAHNEFFGLIPSELGQICSTLEEIDLSGNRLIGSLPSSFALCSSLSSLNLGKNQISGDFVSTVVSSLPNLNYLYLPFNNITGPVPLSLMNFTRLKVLDLSSNYFSGNFPSNFCSSQLSLTLEKLLLSNNLLTGSIPSELANCTSLTRIDLSFNHLTGSIPSNIWNHPALLDLVMWANNLTGEIPEGICLDGGNLQTMILNNNFLSGKIPLSIANCSNLTWISLSSNYLNGEIPAGIGNLLNLAVLQLRNNRLTGFIPPSLGKCKSLIWLDLNTNALTGPIPSDLANETGLVVSGIVSGKHFAFVRNEGGPSCRGAGGLVEFEGIRDESLEKFPMAQSCPSTRIYSGVTDYMFHSNGSMIYLDLSYNSLSGSIPAKLGSMNFLQVLNLGHNNLTGNIPSSFGGLKSVGLLDLSYNDLHGFIPWELGALSFLTDLDVSNNHLIGPIPSGGQLTTFPASRFENNSGLCGFPLLPCSSLSGQLSQTFHGRAKKKSFAIGTLVGISISFSCILLLIYALYRAKKHQNEEERREKYIESLPISGSSSWKISTVSEPLSINFATFEKPLRKLTFAHLLEATNGFNENSLIGSGGFGEVYKAQLGDGCVVAIKKLVHITCQGDREFMAEIETIGKIKHRNLVPLLGYCKIGEERLLVYEYMKWGSLESILHDKAKGEATKLDWANRKKIAMGSARGLAFLHHSCIPHIIHRDMKSSNVLLDEDFEAKVSDFGMARLVNAFDTHLSVSTLAGTPGYVPPEYYQSFRCTTKGDVYSYGVVLLELLSGRRPIDPFQFRNDNNLVGWAKHLHEVNGCDEILDPELLSHNSNKAEMHHYLKIAFECLDDKPFRRPTMIHIMARFREMHVDSECNTLDRILLKTSVEESILEK